MVSLSHVALPISPDDPLYGRRPPTSDRILFLGQMAIQGERGLFKLPTDWLLRIRHNPFYDFLEQRIVDWFEPTGAGLSESSRRPQRGARRGATSR